MTRFHTQWFQGISDAETKATGEGSLHVLLKVSFAVGQAGFTSFEPSPYERETLLTDVVWKLNQLTLIGYDNLAYTYGIV